MHSHANSTLAPEGVDLASLFCKLSNECSGCDKIHLDRSSLEQDRRDDLERLGLGSLRCEVRWIASGGLRDRLEFTLIPFENSLAKLGLFNKQRTEIVDLPECPQLSNSLQAWLTEFREDLPRVPGPRSVRLRVSPDGLRGAWLDFANEDIRDLLEEEKWLSRMLEKNVVIEMGQKRKRVIQNPAGPRRYRLKDATLEPWFETRLRDGTRAAIFGTVGTFTQPGFFAAGELVQTVLEHLDEVNSRLEKAPSEIRIAEFGAGSGCFTLPLLSTGAEVDVFESDRLALSALEKAVTAAGLDPKRLHIHAGDFIQSSRAARLLEQSGGTKPYDTIVVDPPRSGLGAFIESITVRAANADWIYVSCYPESLAKDARLLADKGLKLERLTIVEQFPFTRHYEIVATFVNLQRQQSQRAP